MSIYETLLSGGKIGLKPHQFPHQILHKTQLSLVKSNDGGSFEYQEKLPRSIFRCSYFQTSYRTFELKFRQSGEEGEILKLRHC